MDTTPGPDPAEDGQRHEAPPPSGRPVVDGLSTDDGTGDPEETVTEDGDELLDGKFLDGKDPLRFSNWMKRSATGAVLTSITLGFQRALEVDRKQPAFVIEASDELDDPDRPIELKFDPDSPANTVAIIRHPKEAGTPELPPAP